MTHLATQGVKELLAFPHLARVGGIRRRRNLQSVHVRGQGVQVGRKARVGRTQRIMDIARHETRAELDVSDRQLDVSKFVQVS